MWSFCPLKSFPSYVSMSVLPSLGGVFSVPSAALPGATSATATYPPRPPSQPLSAKDVEELARQSAEQEAATSGSAVMISYTQQV